MVLSDNFRIAEFLGGEVKSTHSIQDVHTYMWYGEIAHQWRREKLKINVGEALLEGHLLFHKSWDWLMPVIDKIESMGYIFNINNYSVCLLAKGTEDFREGTVMCCYYIGNGEAQYNKFKASYKAVVSFIGDPKRTQK